MNLDESGRHEENRQKYFQLIVMIILIANGNLRMYLFCHREKKNCAHRNLCIVHSFFLLRFCPPVKANWLDGWLVGFAFFLNSLLLLQKIVKDLLLKLINHDWSRRSIMINSKKNVFFRYFWSIDIMGMGTVWSLRIRLAWNHFL